MSSPLFTPGKLPLSDQEIAQQMNFEAFIKGHAPAPEKWFRRKGKRSFAITTVIAVIVAVIVHSQKTQMTAEQPFINPPFPALNISADQYDVIADRDTLLVCRNGSLITLPSGTFEDQNGKTVQGKIRLSYREFQDPIEVLLSGIPMKYDSAGRTYQFESAGMFEINASRDGKPLRLRKGKTLQVNMISGNNDGHDFNFYCLDTAKKRWNYVSANTVANKTCSPVFEPLDKARSIATDEPLKMILPGKINQHADNFTIDFQKDEFPELAAFKGLKFEPVAGDPNYRSSLSSKVWDDVLIERDPDKEHYLITFKKEKESHRFRVLPVVDEKEYAATMKLYELNQKKYEQALRERKRVEKLQNDSLYKLNAVYRSIAAESDLNSRFQAFITNDYSGISKDLLTYRTFAISRLGIWNCDRPRPPFIIPGMMQKLSGKLTAYFVSDDNTPLSIKNLFLTNHAFNTVNTVPEKYFNNFPEEYKGMDVMVGVTYDNRLVYLKDEALRNATVSGTNVLFKMQAAGSDIKTPEQLKKLLAL